MPRLVIRIIPLFHLKMLSLISIDKSVVDSFSIVKNIIGYKNISNTSDFFIVGCFTNNYRYIIKRVS